MERKSYKLTFAFDAGYSGEGKVFSREDVERIIEAWLTERVREGKMPINGFLQTGTLFYPSRGRREDDKLVSIAPAGTYEGEISQPADLERDEAEVKEALESLARVIKEGLAQERVYIIYKNEHWFV